MEFKRGTSVWTADGQNVGHLDRVVLDPNAKAITHLVIRAGLLLVEDKVVPITVVAEATATQVVLHNNIDDLHTFPKFEEKHYFAADEHALVNPPREGGPFLPVAYPYQPLAAPPPAFYEEVDENIPAGTVALKEGAQVVAADGKHVGTVEEVICSAADQATHFVISQGIFLKKQKLVPITWVGPIYEQEVHLTVNADTVKHLRVYHN